MSRPYLPCPARRHRCPARQRRLPPPASPRTWSRSIAPTSPRWSSPTGRMSSPRAAPSRAARRVERLPRAVRRRAGRDTRQAAWQRASATVEAAIVAAEKKIAAGKGPAAHEELEAVREAQYALRREAGVGYYMDDLTAFHAAMETDRRRGRRQECEDADRGESRGGPRRAARGRADLGVGRRQPRAGGAAYRVARAVRPRQEQIDAESGERWPRSRPPWPPAIGPASPRTATR